MPFIISKQPPEKRQSRQSKPAYRNAWIRAVCGDDTITGPSNHVTHLLNYFVNAKSGLCCTAQDTLAKTGGISVSTVKRSLSMLEQAGYIHRVKALKGLDLSRFSSAPRARLNYLSFESDGAFPAQC